MYISDDAEAYAFDLSAVKNVVASSTAEASEHDADLLLTNNVDPNEDIKPSLVRLVLL